MDMNFCETSSFNETKNMSFSFCIFNTAKTDKTNNYIILHAISSIISKDNISYQYKESQTVKK